MSTSPQPEPLIRRHDRFLAPDRHLPLEIGGSVTRRHTPSSPHPCSITEWCAMQGRPRRNNDGPPSESTTVTGALYVENLAAAEKLVRRGQFNAAKVLRALAHAQRSEAMNTGPPRRGRPAR